MAAKRTHEIIPMCHPLALTGVDLAFAYEEDGIRIRSTVRVKVPAGTPSGRTQFWSYRDPAVDPTVRRFGEAAAWVAEWAPSEEDLAGYIISDVASFDAPQKPRQLARRQDTLYLSKRSADYRERVRSQKLAVTVEGVRALAPQLATLAENHAYCIFGSRELIEASKLDLEIIDLMA